MCCVCGGIAEASMFLYESSDCECGREYIDNECELYVQAHVYMYSLCTSRCGWQAAEVI